MAGQHTRYSHLIQPWNGAERLNQIHLTFGRKFYAVNDNFNLKYRKIKNIEGKWNIFPL